MRAPRTAGFALLAAPAVLLGLFFLLPLARTLEAALSDASAWEWVATHPYVRSRVLSAFTQAFASVGLTLLLALPLAWFHHRRRVPFGRLHLAVHAAPFVLPVFVVIFGLQAVAGRDGWLDRLAGLDLLSALGPLGAVVLAHAYYNYGFAARLLHATLERRPRRLEEAAQVLGSTPRSAVWRVTLPLLLPSILAVALLVFLFSFASFGVVLYLGEGRVATFETLLYEALGGGFPRYGRAAALGVLQLAANLALFAGYQALWRRRANLPRDPDPRPLPARTVHRGLGWAFAALGAAPALAVLAGGFQVRGAWSLEPWRALLDASHPAHLPGFDLAATVGRSLLYAAAAVAGSLFLALSLAYGLRALGGRGRAFAESVAALPLATSSLLIGFGTLLAFGAGSRLDLRGTAWVLILAHTLVCFPFVARVVLPALEAHDRRLDEAAALLGAPPRSVVWRVHLPLLSAPLAAAAGIAAAMSLGDFGASLLLATSDTMPLAVAIDRHGGAGSFDPLLRAQSVALAGLLALLAAACFLAVEAFRQREIL